MQQVEQLLWGRRATKREVMQHAEVVSLSGAIKIPAIVKTARGFMCQRCGNTRNFYPNQCLCDKQCVYCLDCVAFGVLRRCDYLYDLPALASNDWQRENAYLHFEGKLSPAQQEVSSALVNAFEMQQDHLVWAVTGAGKTEMLFEVIDYALRCGKRVCLAVPRIDVANELYVRFQEAFPEIDVLLLHGQSADNYRYTPLIVCSTHQLVRFYRAFDLLVIDETDAFPFRGDAMLARAVETARREQSTLVYLTATPDQTLRQQVKRGKLTQSLVPARYHRQPLPVPKQLFDFQWERALVRGELPKHLYREMQRLLKNNRRFLVFVPTVKYMQQLEQILRGREPSWRFQAVHAKDEARLEKVQAMRMSTYQFLLTTTILERGVTFEAIDVIVFGSEYRVFSQSALVQIAGRVGRKPWATDGEVLFIGAGRTRATSQAIREIQRMNRLGGQRGLLDGVK